MKTQQAKKPMNRFVRILLDLIMLISLLVAGYSAWNIYHALEEYHEADVAYNEVRQSVLQVDQTTKEEKIDWPTLMQQYPDTMAWIKMANSTIDYPIAYADSTIPSRKGNVYYLDHLMDGRKQSSGTLFLDVNNGQSMKDRVLVVYGHNMKNGSMFADIDKYRRQEYYDGHKEMTLETANEKYKIYPVAGIKTTGTDDYVRYRFSNNEQFLSYVSRFTENSTFRSEHKVQPNDQLILFSTCDYTIEDGRYALLARLVKVNE